MFKKKQKKVIDEPCSKNGLAETIDHAKLLESVNIFCNYLAGIREQCQQQGLQLAQVLQLRNDDLAMLEKCFAAAADCQKQTAEIANSQLERHALHPAIIVVDMLVDLIGQLATQAGSITEIEPDSDVGKLIHFTREAQGIATSQLEHLDVSVICPLELDPVDNDRHEIVKAVDTDDKNIHNKITETLKPGLFYRGTVLRQAKVSVYRYINKTDEKNV